MECASEPRTWLYMESMRETGSRRMIAKRALARNLFGMWWRSVVMLGGAWHSGHVSSGVASRKWPALHAPVARAQCSGLSGAWSTEH